MNLEQIDLMLEAKINEIDCHLLLFENSSHDLHFNLGQMFALEDLRKQLKAKKGGSKNE